MKHKSLGKELAARFTRFADELERTEAPSQQFTVNGLTVGQPLLNTPMNDTNPYSASSVFEQPPPRGSFQETPPPRDDGFGGTTAREVFIAWEKLRLLYNGILVVETVLLVLLLRIDFQRNYFDVMLLVYAAAANVFFCLGPIGEGYAELIGAPRRTVRTVLFLGGTALACLLAYVVLVNVPQ